MLGWDWCGFHKKCVETSYVEVLFLHSVGYFGHVQDSGVSGARHIDALFFMLMWDRYRIHKKHVETRDAEPMLCIR
jgi:hypothetical protein